MMTAPPGEANEDAAVDVVPVTSVTLAAASAAANLLPDEEANKLSMAATAVAATAACRRRLTLLPDSAGFAKTFATWLSRG